VFNFFLEVVAGVLAAVFYDTTVKDHLPITSPITRPSPAPTVTPATNNCDKTAVAPPVFPSAISPGYSNKRPGDSIVQTCRDQFEANENTCNNGGLPWLRVGDAGYYSECKKRLSAAR
jgi:hypothetical protein